MQRSSTWVANITGGKHYGAPRLLRGGVSIDTRTLHTDQLFVPLIARRDGHDFADQAIARGASLLWQSDHPLPPLPLPGALIVVPDTRCALWDMAKAYRQEHGGQVIAVTGSHGKTTCKELLAAVLGGIQKVHKTVANHNNELGVPLTLLSWPENFQIAVVEMGMRRRGEIAPLSSLARPTVAVITSIGDAHGGRLGDRRHILEAKLEITRGLDPNGYLLYDAEYPPLEKALRSSAWKKQSVGLEEGDDYILAWRSLQQQGMDFQTAQTGAWFHSPLLGRHNMKNALFALGVGRWLGISTAVMRKRLATVSHTPGRLFPIAGKQKSLILDDSYNASPISMRAALDTLCSFCQPPAIAWAVLGDMAELAGDVSASHAALGQYAAQLGVVRLFAVGQHAQTTICAYRRMAPVGGEGFAFAEAGEAGEEISTRLQTKVVVLIKGSRCVGLERVVSSLRANPASGGKDR
ncbi:UDP-N-acetylmuramoyl-tripeptide--D-alanyl-D-alanine ligase [Pasteuria penetrans]|uniref:UDP-N-acetylmuramoyl-tripeptide--D-alanyl-D- alanine ligase n=1 Tax=Pasteuria penetrans TaxID=86005 RepID=UPI000F9395F0|nr:UDP-N-acetylmuramoyl-tripeptide--D-alanyl-D-alanine ligase [Pasteuria penetrans]